ncbi:MAG: nucleoside triphosphate pyrophosphatase [Candidatus Dormibacteria bacterium]
MRLVLASASPRRRELLEAAGIQHEVVVSGFDESSVRHLRPLAQARSAARGKAAEVATRRPDAWVVGCDTVVALDGAALGKPADGVEASRMLRRLAGREHLVYTAVCLQSPAGERAQGHGVSRVAFADLGSDEIHAYIATGEPMDKAGAYAIQGKAGDFAALVSGSTDTVVGLPLHVLHRLGRQLGLW